MKKSYQITDFCHRFLQDYIMENDRCLDATAGNGNDTEFLCRMAGPGGKIYAFDIQKEALEHTRRRLEEAGLLERAVLIEDGHEHMRDHVKELMSVIVFNFGYLPGGDHRIATRSETSIIAVRQGLDLLKQGGVMSLCIYSGGDTGYGERDALLKFLQELDAKKWLVIVNSFYNRKNDPPLPVFVIRLS